MKKNEKLTPKNFLKGVSKKKIRVNKDSDGNYLKCLSIENLYDKKENSEYYHDLRLLLNSTSSCEISDALYSLTNNNGVLKDLKSINGLTAYGEVITVETSSNDWGTSALAIDKAKEGEVILINAYSENNSNGYDLIKSKSMAVWGELTSIAAKNKKIAGTFVLGYIRDLDNLIGLDYPVFAFDVCPNAGSALGHGTINCSISSHHSHINPGDFIFGDKNGVVLIPKGLFEIAMKKVIAIKTNERNIYNNLEKGKSLSEIIGLK
ncbi:MAG: RraA family protein [Methanobrevibacter sp.]|jgi:3-hexulose-6-phosphate synthase|nr:RraA family protein [Candidatus Methanovirga meridionalis]